MADVALTERLTRFEVQGVPVGWAVTLTAGIGIGNAVAGTIAGLVGIKPQWAKLGLGIGLAMIPFFGKNLGSDTASLLSAGLIASGINNAWALQERTENWVTGIFGRVERKAVATSSSESSGPGGNGHSPDAMQTLRNLSGTGGR